MKLTNSGNVLTVTRESGDPRMPSESAFWYALKNRLNALGFDFIKRNPGKDGHLTSAPYYLRDRKWRAGLHDGDYAIRMLHLDYNRGEARLLWFR